MRYCVSKTLSEYYFSESVFYYERFSINNNRQIHRAELGFSTSNFPGGGIGTGVGGRFHGDNDLSISARRDGPFQVINGSFVELIAAHIAIVGIVRIPTVFAYIGYLPTRLKIRLSCDSGIICRGLRKNLTGKVCIRTFRQRCG